MLLYLSTVSFLFPSLTIRLKLEKIFKDYGSRKRYMYKSHLCILLIETLRDIIKLL